MRRLGSALAALLVSSACLVACEAPAALGVACTLNSQCSAPLSCAFGRCRSACRLNRDCTAGTVCRLDAEGNGSCALADDPDCGPSAPCAEGLLCVDRACVNACTTVAECPSDSECVAASDGRTRCLPSSVVDAGASDASGDASDAGTSCIVGPPCDPIVEIGAGAEHVCARAQSGAVWCWGTAESGQLGQTGPTEGCIPDRHCSPIPLRVPYLGALGEGPITTAIDLDVSPYNACAVVHDDSRADVGAVVCWGLPTSGTLGDVGVHGMPAKRVVLDDATGYLDADAVEIVLGESFAISRHASGREYGWGNDHRAQLRLDGSLHAGAVPVETVPDHLGLALGWTHGCTRVVDDATTRTDAWCWGSNDTGQSGGIGPFMSDSVQSEPARIALGALDSVRAVEVGGAHSCALTQGGDVWCWGNGLVDGSLEVAGTPRCTMGFDRFACPPAPVFRPGAPFAVLGSTTTSTACAIDEDGAVWCWGEFGPTVEEATGRPTRIGTLEGATAVTTGASVGCLLTQDGDVWCWGANYNGQLGRGVADDTSTLVPAPVAWPTQ